MEPVILVSSLVLAAAAQGAGPSDSSPGQNPASSPPPAATQDAKPAQRSATRKPRTTSPPGTTPMPPMPNVDRGIQLPPNRSPESSAPGDSSAPPPDSAKPGDNSVKPVPPAPSKPGEPGVRPLGAS